MGENSAIKSNRTGREKRKIDGPTTATKNIMGPVSIGREAVVVTSNPSLLMIRIAR